MDEIEQAAPEPKPIPEAQGEVALAPVPFEAGEQDAVDIHRPKPVHSWREFLSEIGVVVIGVLIALGGEQLVEAVH